MRILKNDYWNYQRNGIKSVTAFRFLAYFMYKIRFENLSFESPPAYGEIYFVVNFCLVWCTHSHKHTPHLFVEKPEKCRKKEGKLTKKPKLEMKMYKTSTFEAMCKYAHLNKSTVIHGDRSGCNQSIYSFLSWRMCLLYMMMKWMCKVVLLLFFCCFRRAKYVLRLKILAPYI